jgi:putative transcriptional regulator
MAIVVRLDVMLALRKVRSKDLAAHIGITESNLSLLKSGRVRGVRFETLDLICDYLDCQPGDILVRQPRVADLNGELAAVLRHETGPLGGNDCAAGPDAEARRWTVDMARLR